MVKCGEQHFHTRKCRWIWLAPLRLIICGNTVLWCTVATMALKKCRWKTCQGMCSWLPRVKNDSREPRSLQQVTVLSGLELLPWTLEMGYSNFHWDVLKVTTGSSSGLEWNWPMIFIFTKHILLSMAFLFHPEILIQRNDPLHRISCPAFLALLAAGGMHLLHLAIQTAAVRHSSTWKKWI